MLKQPDHSHTISGATRVFAIIGDPVAHSLSPSFWNAALCHLKHDAIYVPLRAENQNSAIAFAGLKALNISGVNVTMPLKSSFAGFCDKLHYPADVLGAVNTVKFSEITEGWNTDAIALKKIFSSLKPFNKALVIGAGASAQAVLWALSEVGIKAVVQISRRFGQSVVTKNTDFHKELAWHKKNFAYAIAESDIIIHTTPLGWKKDDFIAELEEFLDQNKIYVDLNYAPDSKLIAAAHKCGCKVVDGRELLIEQGLASFRILTGLEPPQQLIRDCVYNQA